jgi:CHAT domain-containing protein
VHEENQNIKKEYDSFISAYTLLKTSKGLKYQVSSPIAGVVSEKSILTAKKVMKYKEATKIQVNYTAAWKRSFDRNNFYRLRIDMLQASRQVVEQDFEEAEKALSSLIAENSIVPKTHLGKIEVLSLLNQIDEHNDEFDDIEKNLLEIIRLKKELLGEHTPSFHQSQLDLANFYVKYSSKFKLADEIYKQSLEKVIAKELDYKSKYYINHLYNQSKLFQFNDQFLSAQNILNKVIDKIKNRYGLMHLFYAEALEKSASLDIELADYNTAKSKLESSMATLEALSKEQNVAKQHAEALEAMALIQILESDYTNARKTLQKANKLIKGELSTDQQQSSVANEELIYLNIYTGMYQGTEKMLQKSIQTREKRFGSKSRTLITPYNQLGELYVISGDYTKAEEVARKASVISMSVFGDSSLKYAESLNLMEKVYLAIGDYAKAQEAIVKAKNIQISKYGPDNFHVAQSLNNLALAKYYNKADASEIETDFKQSLKILKNTLGEKNPEYAEVLKNLAMFYIDQQKTTEASPLLNNAFNIYLEKFGKENIHTAEILILQGNLNYLKKNYADAKSKYTEAGSIYAKIFDEEHPNYIRTLSLVGQMNYIMGELKTAIKNYDFTTSNYLNFIKKYFPALSEREKTKFWNLIKNDFEFYNTLAVKVQKENPAITGNLYNFALNTKAILLNSSIKVKERILASKDQDLIKKFEDFVSKKEFMASALSMSNEERKSNNVDLKSLEKELESLEKDLSAKSELFASNLDKNPNHTWEKVREVLKPNEIAVEMVRFRKYNTSFSDTIYYAALIISPESKSQPQLVLLENGKSLETRNIKYYRNSMKLKSEDKLSYEAFWAPLKKYIKDNSVVYFSPDGVYNQINIETLISPEGKAVIDNHEIITISSTRDLLRKKISTTKKKGDVLESNSIALFGNPTYYTTTIDENSTTKIDQLLGAEKEVKEIFNLTKKSSWNSKLYIGNIAEEDSVKALKNPKVFHIATHGFFLEDAQNSSVMLNDDKLYRNPLLRSGLLLKNGGTLLQNSKVAEFNTQDGVLTAYEAMNLNFDNTDLVVLSACETGLGEVQIGEGVYGLQRSFLVAGAQSIIMSLFKVNDEVTQEMMMSFYAKLIKHSDRRKAFIEAKKEIKQKYQDPIFWGSFVMIGLN